MIGAVHPIDLMVLWPTTGCQLRCRYCYMRGGDAAREDLDPAVFAQALATLPIRPGAVLQIAGGEPTLVPDLLEEIVALARRAGFGRILVQTNGIAIDARFLALVRDNRLGVGVSLDGPAEINDALRGRTAEVLAGLRHLDAAGIGFGITTVLTRDSVASLPRLAMLLAGFSGVRSIGLDILRPVGRGGLDDLPRAAEVAKAHAALREALGWINARRAQPIKLREDSMVGCGGDRTGAYCPAERGAAVVLVPSGALYPCASVAGDPDYACGSAGRPDFAALARGLRAPDDSCAGCTLAGCRGRCPARALLSPRAAGLDCVLRRGTDRHAAESARHG